MGILKPYFLLLFLKYFRKPGYLTVMVCECVFFCFFLLFMFAGWSFRSSVDIIVEVPIWLLGQCYHAEEKEKGESGVVASK